jgi:quinohemoprotein ethanol dehydrogenase
MMARAVAVLLAVSVTLSACSREAMPASIPDADDGGDWQGYGRGPSEAHYSPLKAIDRASVARLGLASAVDLDVMQRVDSQPIAVGGIVYVAVGLSIVQAIDPVSGKVLWRYDPDVATVAGDKLKPSWGIRGLAFADGRLFVGTQDGRLIAIDARSGRPVWSRMTLDKDSDSTITGAPRVFKGKVIIGFGGADRGLVRGAVSCYDALTGRFLWRFHTVPGDPARGFENSAMKMAAKTWSGEWWKLGGGGTVWNAITFDAELNRIYLGTGNGGPWNWKIRNPKGLDNLFLASIVALDAETGRYIWHYQQNPNEAWDYNATMDIALATVSIEGRRRRVILQAPKNGFFYVLDRDTGKLISAEKIGRVSWADRIDLKTGRPVDTPNNRYQNGPMLIWPSNFGTHNWQAMSFSPRTGLAYIPAIHMAGALGEEGLDRRKWRPHPGSWNTGMGGASSIRLPVEDFSSALLAWDPVRQKAAWSTATPGIVNGGTMATGGDLVFHGHVDGTFAAYDATSGKRLWHFQSDGAVMGAPISYKVGGQQFISVLTGPVSGSVSALPGTEKFGWDYRDTPRRLLSFALGASGTLPARLGGNSARPLPSPTMIDRTLAAAGGQLYADQCVTCHGAAAVSGGAAPDLRASTIPLEAASFNAVVVDGVLVSRGMPKFPRLSDKQLLSLRHYIRREAILAAVR